MRIHLIADEGKIYTNGTIYGTDIYLAEGVDSEDFYMIDRAEYEAKMKKKDRETNFLIYTPNRE